MLHYDPLQETVLFEHELLGTAVSNLPPDYEGPCELVVQGRTGQSAVFPTVDDACAAARFAVGELGGYLRAQVKAGRDLAVTHRTWSDWAFQV